ncbi:hypothetical protein [Streptomyces sp. CBMA123]|uniref:hypothetical protein n=1 Tax=Streptomyces sp. CBMA123 TaxID=1896313 RepID=UPI0016620864|nr:hypothetical protein [Streptomyces sp. CBMA123]MBD0692466.1 hypothetical protein [Streptomyces sp. CBMA123]
MTAATIVPTTLMRQVIEGMRWLGGHTRDPEATWRVWAEGRAVPIPIGDGFAVVRLPEALGQAAVRALAGGTPSLVGPVLADHSAGVIEVLVPLAPAVWQGTGAELIDGSRLERQMVKCPPPSRRADGRDWLYLPRALPGRPAVLTDPYRLSEAVSIARSQLVSLAGQFNQ